MQEEPLPENDTPPFDGEVRDKEDKKKVETVIKDCWRYICNVEFKENRIYRSLCRFFLSSFAILKKCAAMSLAYSASGLKSNFFIGLVTVFLANLFFLSGIETTIDLTIGKDATALVKVLDLSIGDIWRTADSGWLYLLYLKLISFFVDDAADAYYANITVLSVLSTTLIYTYSRMVSGKTANSVMVSFLWMICCFNVSLYDKVNLFALCVVLFGFIIAEFFSSASLRFLTVGVFLFFASYAEEVYFIPFVMAFIAAALIVLFDIRRRWRELIPLLLFSVIFYYAEKRGVSFIGGKGISFIDYFKECFFLNWQEWQEITTSQLYDGEYKNQIWLGTFGDTDNFLMVFLASPFNLFHHLFTNFFNMLRIVGENLFFHYPIFSPTNSYRSIAVEGMIFVTLFISFFGGALEHEKSRLLILKKYGPPMTIWGIILFFPLVGSVLFYPYSCYIVQIGCFFLLFGSFCGFELLANMGMFLSENKKALTLFCFCLLCVVPRVYTMPPKTDIMVNPSRIFGKSYATLPIRETVDFISSLNIANDVNVYGIEPGYTSYLPKNYHAVPLPQNGIKSFIAKKKIDMVIETSGFSTSPKNKDLIKFLKNPEAYGYYAIDVPGLSENRIILRNDLACGNPICRKKINNNPEKEKDVKNKPDNEVDQSGGKTPIAKKKFSLSVLRLF